MVLPVYVQASISCKRVYKFAENTVSDGVSKQSGIGTDRIPQKVSGVHISDLTALYGRIVEKILQRKAPPSSKEGYYFALAHDLIWWEVLDQLAVALNARGLVTDSQTHFWPSDDVAAESMGIPVQFVQPLWNSG